MRIPSHHNDTRSSDVAMTPMIDVVFQLMIFFICTASFRLAEESLPANLSVTGGPIAAAPTSTDPELERVVLHAAQTDGRTTWVVNERPCNSLDDVRQVLVAVAQTDRGIPVVLDVAATVPLGDMIDAYDLCRLIGFQKVQFAAERKS